MFRENPADIKQSLIQDLYFSGALKDFSFKVKATAFLIAKGYRNAEEAVFIFRHECLGLKHFYPEVAVLFAGVFTESDFYTYQSIIESIIGKILKLSFSDRTDLLKLNNDDDPNFLKNIWERLKAIRENFTQKQTELVELLYLNRPQMTYEEASETLGISFDSVRDREDGVILKIKKEFTEFNSFSPYKDYHKNNQVIWSYIGCRHNPMAEKIHPYYRIKMQNGVEVKELIIHGDLVAEKLKRALGLFQNTVEPVPLVNFVRDSANDHNNEPLNTAGEITP